VTQKGDIQIFPPSPSAHHDRTVKNLNVPFLVVAIAGGALALTTLSGCMRGCSSSKPPIHVNPSMFNQPKYRPYASSEFFYDGKAMRAPVAGTIARGHLPGDPAIETGKGADGSPVASSPIPGDEALLARGHERFDIYCKPCHDERGEGKGVLFQRAKVPTANLLEQRFRDLPDGAIFDTITNGKGLMPAYRYPIHARDRWAIIAYVRSLQKADVEREAAK
jgi:mono/diheme cytochrome c family protein